MFRSSGESSYDGFALLKTIAGPHGWATERFFMFTAVLSSRTVGLN